MMNRAQESALLGLAIATSRAVTGNAYFASLLLHYSNIIRSRNITGFIINTVNFRE